jgi:polyferredoxin
MHAFGISNKLKAMPNTKHILYGLLVFAAFACAILMLTGCSKAEPPVADPYPDMTGDLRMMQGSWSALDTNGCIDCGAVIDGYAIRMRFKNSPEAPMVRQNASIARLDEQRKLILLNNGYAAWPYFIGKEAGQDHLELEFYNETGSDWVRVHLQRDDAQL